MYTYCVVGEHWIEGLCNAGFPAGVAGAPVSVRVSRWSSGEDV